MTKTMLNRCNVGRKPKKKADRKTNCLQVMMTDRERAIIDRAARAAGEDTSTWVRQRILAIIQDAERAASHEQA